MRYLNQLLRPVFLVAATLLSLLNIDVAVAHHSAAMFNMEEEVVLKGTVKKFQFTNPHVWIHLQVVNEDGTETLWKIEALNPNALKRKGWKRNTFKAGDEVTVTAAPAKSGKPKANFIRAITADGSEIGQKQPDREH